MSFVQLDRMHGNAAVKINYQDWGQGTPVVFIHGWPLSWEMWEYQMTELSTQGLRCIAYDRRGFGMSDKPGYGYDYDTLADDLKGLLEALDLENVTLVGFSMGGGEVVRYFSRHGGERVNKVVLVSSVAPSMLKTESNPQGVDQSVFDEMTAKMKEDRIAFLDSFGKQFFGVNLINKPVSGPLLDYYRMLGSCASPLATLECAKAFSQTNFTNEMMRLNVPTLIIHGDADKTVPIEATGERAAQLVPDNQYIVYEGAPHGLFYTEKDRLNQDLLQFIQTGTVAAQRTEFVDVPDYVPM